MKVACATGYETLCPSNGDHQPLVRSDPIRSAPSQKRSNRPAKQVSSARHPERDLQPTANQHARGAYCRTTCRPQPSSGAASDARVRTARWSGFTMRSARRSFWPQVATRRRVGRPSIASRSRLLKSESGGYDGGKNITGRERRGCVDPLGVFHALPVREANMRDPDEATMPWPTLTGSPLPPGSRRSGQTTPTKLDSVTGLPTYSGFDLRSSTSSSISSGSSRWPSARIENGSSYGSRATATSARTSKQAYQAARYRSAAPRSASWCAGPRPVDLLPTLLHTFAFVRRSHLSHTIAAF